MKERCVSWSLKIFLLTQGKVALSACNHRFVTVASNNRLMAISEKAKEKEILTVS